MVQYNVFKGDITTLCVDAIVNAANKELRRGSGVCGAIFSAAGPELEKECAKIGFCETGRAVITNAYLISAKRIIHAVGPIYNINSQNAPVHLASAYNESLNLAEKENLKSIAFPCISTGVYGYPPEDAAAVAYKTCTEFKFKKLIGICFCCFTQSDYDIYRNLLGLRPSGES